MPTINSFTKELNLFSDSDQTGKGCVIGFDANNDAQLYVQSDITQPTSTDGAFKFNGDLSWRIPYNGGESQVASLSMHINQAKSERDTETSARVSGDTTLQGNLDSESARALAAEGDNEAAIIAEAAQARSAESNLSGLITTEAGLRETADSAISSDLSNEITRATGAESALNSSISTETLRAQGVESTNASAISAEADRAALAEAANATNLTDYETSNNAALAQEVADRASAVTTLQADVDAKNNARMAGISTVNDALTAEVTAREAADAALQTQITNIVNNSDPEALDSLTEIVAEFQANDSSLEALAGANHAKFTAWVDNASYESGDTFTTQMNAVLARLVDLETTIANLQGP